MNYPFSKTNHYRLIEGFFDSKKDFIVLGLCGKTGSGSTTVADILQKSFEQLNLPVPSDNSSDSIEDHEYRLLYTYAKVHWKPFYRVKTSALITAHVLNESVDVFLDFLNKFLPDSSGERNKATLKQVVSSFFDTEICFDLKKWIQIDPEDKKIAYNWLTSDYFPTQETTSETTQGMEKLRVKFTPTTSVHHSDEASDYIDCQLKLEGSSFQSIQFRYDKGSACSFFTTKDLYKLFLEYKKRRQEKKGFDNPLLIFLLQQFIYDDLPSECTNLWNRLAQNIPDVQVTALQQLGNHLRISGQPYSTSFDPKAYTTIVVDINAAIKLLNASLAWQKKWIDDEGLQERANRSLVVVDSIKNPFESMYLKERYTSYYLMGIYTEDRVRWERLRRDQHFSDAHIQSIDIIEQMKEFKRQYKCFLSGQKSTSDLSPAVINTIQTIKKHQLLDELPFILQNVGSCLENADIFINNETDSRRYLQLKRKLIRYVSLIMNPGLVLPSPVERCMQLAYTAKLNSGCISRQVGAAITDAEYHLLSIGWNQQPEGQVPCSYRDLCSLYYHWSPEAYSDYECDDQDQIQKRIKEPVIKLLDTPDCPLTIQGKLPAFCFKDIYNSIMENDNQVHPRSLHAEETAFLNLGQHSARGGILFTTSSPCELCSKKAKYEGIAKIYYIEPYSGISLKHVLNIGSNASRPQMLLFTGAIGRAYTQLYTPLLPKKDELAFWLGTKVDVNLLDQIQKKVQQASDASSLKEKEDCDV